MQTAEKMYKIVINFSKKKAMSMQKLHAMEKLYRKLLTA